MIQKNLKNEDFCKEKIQDCKRLKTIQKEIGKDKGEKKNYAFTQTYLTLVNKLKKKKNLVFTNLINLI